MLDFLDQMALNHCEERWLIDDRENDDCNSDYNDDDFYPYDTTEEAYD